MAQVVLRDASSITNLALCGQAMESFAGLGSAYDAPSPGFGIVVVKKFEILQQPRVLEACGFCLLCG